jgi:hypothetical protein
MNSIPPQTRLRSWLLLGLLLLVCNGIIALHTTPFSLLAGYDSIQYQLLARNRLAGHYELGEKTQTVGLEGCHPMWRPGLVWIEEGLARCLGSVAAAAALASAVGVTLVELLILWLAWRCFGRGACVAAGIFMLAPFAANLHLMRMVLSVGPESWAIAMILAGLAALIEALTRHSWTWAMTAGIAAGLSEWFRTGNLLLFTVPCLVYSLAALRQRDGKGVALAATTLVGFLAMVALSRYTDPSAVDKTVANLWAILFESGSLSERRVSSEEVTEETHLEGLEIVLGTSETYYDHFVRCSRGRSVRQFFQEHADILLPLYLDRLGREARDIVPGLRWVVGGWIAGCFAVQPILCLRRETIGRRHTLAFALGALAHYLGPVVLISANRPTHYLFLILPFILLVAAGGVMSMLQLVRSALGRCSLDRQTRTPWHGWAIHLLWLAPLVWMSALYYRDVLWSLNDCKQQAAEEQAAVDALDLQGRKVACVNMSFFVDRNVHTVLLPYARVAELERYAAAQEIDGILLWENEPWALIRATPYGSLTGLDQALRQSTAFDPPRISGAWRWYPVRRASRLGQPL